MEDFLLRFDDLDEHDPFVYFKDDFEALTNIKWDENIPAYLAYCQAKISLSQAVMLKKIFKEIEEISQNRGR